MADLPITSDEGANSVSIVGVVSPYTPITVATNGCFNTFADSSGSGTVAALNGAVTVTPHGAGTVIFNITGTWVATLILQAQASDGNWINIVGLVPPTIVAGTFNANEMVVVSCGGFFQVRLIATAYTSGTANIAWNYGAGTQAVQVYNSGFSPLSVSAPTLTKGTQGSTGYSVQDLKDAGRTYVTFTADAVAGVTAETLLTFTVNKQGTATASQTNYTVTSGKTLRIQSITIGVQAGAAAGEWVRVKLRHNTAGATTTASSLVLTAACGTGNATTAGMGEESFPIPDGLEIFGNGTQTIALTHLSSATTNVESITLVGYEY